MSLSTIFSAAVVGILASTASAATFKPDSKNNVAVYWGQGYAQGPLSDVCADPNVDIVNIGFVTQFPKAVGDYPVTNFGNACWGYYDLPNGADGTGYVLKNCAGVGDAIKLCQKNGKKVLLSLGGGAAPADYYLPSKKVAHYFGDWLWSAFGPATAAWTNADKPRPFGDAVIDGFDLDIESGSRWDYYSDFVNHLKEKKQSMIFSAAPQCISPDPRLAEAIKNAPFDFIFTQFYNTPECSARQGLTDLGKAKTGFSFDKWATWLQANSKNPDVKLYIGLAAGVQGAGAAHADHYLAPTEAFRLITQYQGHAKFGGVMLWEWTVSVNNQRFGRAYLDWIKYSLNGTFKQMYKPMVSSSSVRTSTTISSTSTQLTSTLTTKTSSVTPSSSATPSKSATPSSSAAVSTLTPTKSATSASSVMTTLTPTETVIASSTASSTSVVETYSESVIYSESFSVVYPSTVISASEISSVYPSETPSTSDVLSSVLATEVSSVYPTEIPSTSEIVSTVSATEVSSVYPSETPLTSDVLSSVLATEVSSVYPSETPLTSDVLSSVLATEVSSVYPSETPLTSDIISTVSATEVSSVYPSEIPTDIVSTVSATEVSSVYPSETLSASEILSTIYPSEIPSASDILSTVYPSETASEYSSSALPTEASTVYPSQNSTGVPYPTKNATSTASGYYGYPTGTGSPSIVYPVDVSTVYPEDVSTVYPSNTEVYDSFVLFSSTKTNGAHATASVSCTSSSATHAPVYPTASSSVGVPEASTKKPEYPADATTTVVTTTYVDVCPTGLTTKTAVVTQTVCSSCQKPEYPADWTTSVYVSSTMTVTITKPVHAAPTTDVPAYPTGTGVAEYPAPKPSTPEGEVPSHEVPSHEVPSHEVPSHETPSHETPSHEVPSHEVPSHEVPSHETAVYDTPKASSTVTYAQTPAPYVAGPAPHGSYPAGNGTEQVVPSGTAAPAKPISTGYPVIPIKQSPPEFEGAAGRVSVGLGMVVGVVAMLVL